jgi:arylsulfatase A-like enzyme
MRALVISVRGFHAGYLSCYGNEWISTPALDRLAADGVLFDQHLADVPDTAATRRAWRTGRYQLPPIEGIPEAETSPSGLDLLAELGKSGVRTVLVADGSRPLPPEFMAGWDEMEVVTSLVEEATFLEQTVESARATLQRLAPLDNWLLWIDLSTLLPPWEVPAEFSDPYFQVPETEQLIAEEEEDEEWDEDEDFETEEPDEEEVEEEVIEEEFEEEEAVAPSDEEEGVEEEILITPWLDPEPGLIDTEDDEPFMRLQASYAAAVSFLDAAVDALYQEVSRLELAASSLFILMGDHGLALGEHDVVGPYRPWLHDELIHTPLLLVLPPSLASGRETANIRVSALTQSPDLMPTLLDAFGVPIPEGLQGHSLLPLAREEVECVRDYAVCGLRQGEAAEWCLRIPEWAYLLPAPPPGDPERVPQLYRKPEDRWEANDLLQHRLDLAEGLEQTLREFVAAVQRTRPFQAPPLVDGRTTEESEEARGKAE